MRKLLFFDLETTGVDHTKHGIHQLAGAVIIDGVVKERFDIKMQPNERCVIEDAALAIAGITREDLKSYMPMHKGYGQFMSVIGKYCDKFNKQDKFYLAGFNNASFDNPFLRQWFIDNGEKYFGSYFWSNCIDIMVMATPFLMDVRSTMENFKLNTVAKALGIELDETKLHDAMYDIDITMQVYDKISIKKV